MDFAHNGPADDVAAAAPSSAEVAVDPAQGDARVAAERKEAGGVDAAAVVGGAGAGWVKLCLANDELAETAAAATTAGAEEHSVAAAADCGNGDGSDVPIPGTTAGVM